jgi:hypothetical protein
MCVVLLLLLLVAAAVMYAGTAWLDANVAHLAHITGVVINVALCHTGIVAACASSVQ